MRAAPESHGTPTEASWLCLVVGGRDLSEEEFVGWFPRYKDASMALEGRSAILATIFSELEKDLTCLGMTAVNDQLQGGVPKTVDMLHKAGIRIIVLTGDKRETAISIAYDASLVDTSMHLLEIALSSALFRNSSWTARVGMSSVVLAASVSVAQRDFRRSR